MFSRSGGNAQNIAARRNIPNYVMVCADIWTITVKVKHHFTDNGTFAADVDGRNQSGRPESDRVGLCLVISWVSGY